MSSSYIEGKEITGFPQFTHTLTHQSWLLGILVDSVLIRSLGRCKHTAQYEEWAWQTPPLPSPLAYLVQVSPLPSGRFYRYWKTILKNSTAGFQFHHTPICLTNFAIQKG